MEILEEQNVMIQVHIQPDYAQKLSGVELDDAVHVRLSAFVNKLAAAGSYDTNSRLNRLEESITEVLTSRVLGQIHTQITTPLAREGSRQTGLIDRISDKIEEGAAHLRDAFNKSRIENGARIVDLNTISNNAKNAKAAWVNPDDAGIAGGSDKSGAAAGDSANGQEEVEGLPWLKKEQASAKNPPPPPTKPKPLSKKLAEDAAGQRVIDEINNQQELLGQPITIPDNPLLKLNLNPQPVEQAQIAESSGTKTLSDVGNNLFKDFLAPDKMGTSEFMNPLKMSWSAAMEIKEYIEENAIYGIMKIPGGRYTLEKVSAVMHPVSTVLHAGAEGAAKLVLTEQEISVLKQKFNEQPNGIQILGRDILEILLFGGATKVASTTFKTAATITKPLAKTGLDSLKSAGNKTATFVSEVGDSLLPPLNPAFAGFGAGFEAAEKSVLKTTIFTAEVMEGSATVTKKIGTQASGAENKPGDLLKKFEEYNFKDPSTTKIELHVDGASAPEFFSQPTHYKHFPVEVEWTSTSGTKQTYNVYQRADIDWDRIRTEGPPKYIGKTNREAALDMGYAPELADKKFVAVHHIGQNSQGPLVEVTSKIHDIRSTEFKILHNQFGKKKHPEFPVDHSKWGSEKINYWKWRAKNE